MDYLTVKYIWDQNMFLQDKFSRQANAITLVAVNKNEIDNHN